MAQFQTRIASAKFIAKHLDECKFEICRVDFAGDEILDLAATGLLGTGDFQQEQGATRIRIDLDKLWPIVRQVKVVTKKDAVHAWIVPGDPWRPAKNLVTVRLEGYDVLNRPDNFLHLLDMVVRDKYGRVGEQVRVAGLQARPCTRLTEAGLERFLQHVMVDTDAVAMPV